MTDSAWRMKRTLIVSLTMFAMAFPFAQGAEQTGAKKSKPPAEKKEFELPKSGKNIERQQGGWINFDGQGSRLVLKFFDKDKKPVAPDMETGLVQLRYSSKNPARAPLYREGDLLVTPGTVRPPHNFGVILGLSKADRSEPQESYTFRYP